MIKHQDEILLPAVSSDRTAVPRYDVVAPDGQTIYENVALKLANDVAQPGTPINKPLLDEFLAASGITAGSATAYTLAQEGYSLFDGAPVRFRLHTASGGNATLNINGTGAKPLRDVLGETMNEGIPAGTWLTATYSAAAGAYIIMSGGVKRSIDEAINGEQYTVDDAVGYAKDVPEKVLPYAEISEIGGMTYKDGNILRSAAVTAVESVGANLISYPYVDTTKTIGGITFTDNGDGGITLSGKATASVVFVCSNYHNAPLPIGYYSAIANNLCELRCFHADGTPTTFSESGDIVNVGKPIVQITLLIREGKSYNGVIYPMLNSGTTALPYAPFSRDTLPIPEAVRALDGFGWGINEDVYNYIDWKNKRFIKRVGKAVFDGTESWTFATDSDNLPFYRVLSWSAAHNARVGGSNICNILNTNYPAEGSLSISGNLNAYIVSTYTTLDEWKARLAELYASGNPMTIYYELITPIITDISSLLPADNILRVQPRGTVTPINEHGYAVPSTITYQRNVLNNRASTFEVEKVRAQQNGITVTLAAGAWSGNTQTIAVPGVTADNTVICSPDPASHDAYGKYGVYCISQADGQLTFRCKRTPDTALAVNIIAMGG